MSDTSAKLGTLRALRDATADPAQRAALDAAISALEAQANPAPHQSSQRFEGDQAIGAAVGGDVRGDLTLFTGAAQGNYIAEVINLYQQAPAAPQADYAAALRRYLRHLYVTHATLDLRGIDQRQMDMPLSEVYVSLTLRELAPAEGVLRGAFRSAIERVRQWAGAKQQAEQAEPEQERAVEWTKVLRHPRLAVIGLPGSGKTTLLQYTAVRLCEVLARDDTARLADLGLGTDAGVAAPPVPLLLPLRELGAYLGESRVRELAGANARLLLDCLANYYAGFDLNLPADFFQKLCEAGRAILLLDGLDEVPQTADRVLVSAIVRSFVNRYDRCRYVLTSRPKAYEGDARLGQGFRECTVDDLSPEQQQRFISNWSRSLHRLLGFEADEVERHAARFSDDLWGALEANKRVQDLATNPLLLTIIAIIYYDSRSLPENRAELYEACVTVLLKGGRGKVDRAAKQRETYGGSPDLTMSLRQKRELLAFVAYRMHQRGEDERSSNGREIGRADLLAIVADAPALPAAVPPREAAEAFVDELPVHVGLLDEIRPEVFRFSHLSFQEFLAARYVAESERWEELLDHYWEPWWYEVILLCAGHLSQERCWRFLELLIERGNSDRERAGVLMLAADAIAELEKFKGQGPLNARIQAEAVRILERQPADAVPAAARVACGHALSIVGDPRPGVCDLPPVMVPFAGGKIVLGSSEVEVEQVGKEAEQFWLERNNPRFAKFTRNIARDELGIHSVEIAKFELARYPVTNAQYYHFIAVDGYNPTAPWWDDSARQWLIDQNDESILEPSSFQRNKHKDHPAYWHDVQIGIARPNHPVVGISWYEATAFCIWLTLYLNDGFVYRLPSEAEWEHAARGMERRTYPWGNEVLDGKRANYGLARLSTTAVGCFPMGATPEGLLDMVGNVGEWICSVYKPYPYDPHDGRENPDTPKKESFVIRGGAFGTIAMYLRSAQRSVKEASYRASYTGMRLARHRRG